jgi:hypothetical protein
MKTIIISLEILCPSCDPIQLQDATVMMVNEYINRRTPVDEYVEKRYKHMDDKFRDYKLKKVSSIVNDLTYSKISVVEV